MYKMTSLNKICLALLAATNLVACGGGGSSSSTPTPPTVTPTPSTPPVASVPVATPTPVVTTPTNPTPVASVPVATPTPVVTPPTNSYSSYENPNKITDTSSFYTLKPDIKSCKYGLLTDKVKQDVLNEVNYVRKLHGLEPLTYNPAYDQMMAETALAMAAENTTSHIIDEKWQCYSENAKIGAAHASLSNYTGVNRFIEPTYDISGYLREIGSPSIGHRRWLLSPFIHETAFGMADGDKKIGGIGRTTGMALYMYDAATYVKNSTKTIPGLIAYPTGDYPRKYFQKGDRLSFFIFYDQTSYDNNWLVDYKNSTVTVKDSKGNIQPIDGVDISFRSSGVPNSYSFLLPSFEYGERYTVNVDNVKVNNEIKNYQYQFKVE